MSKKTKIINLGLSFISLFGFIFITNLNKNTIFINSILCVMLLIFFYKIINKYLFKEKENKRLTIFSLIISIILSFTFTVGYNLTIYDHSYLEKITTHIQIISILPILYSLAKLLLLNIENIKQKSNKINIKSVDKFLFNTKTFIKSFILILLAWFPIFLAFYPGIFSYDSSVQLNEVINHSLSNGSPVVHTIIVGKCVELGKALFNSYNTGIAIYSIIQMILFATSLSFSISYLNKKKTPTIFKLITLLICMFLPTFSMMSITTTKDVFFASFVTMLIPYFIEMVTNSSNYFKSKKQIIITIILVLLVCIFRHNGFYAFLVFSVFALIGLRKYWKKMLLIIMICIISYKSYSIGITKILNQTDENLMAKSAVMCVPMQQFGRLYKYKEKLTDYEKEMLESLVTHDAFNLYEAHKSDAIAWYFNSNKIYDNPMPYLKLYIKLGIKYPITYIDSFLANTMGYWYVGDELPDKSTYRTYIEIRTRDDFKNTNDEIKFESKIPFIYNLYYDLIEKDTYQQIPILSLIMSVPFNILILLILSIIIIYQKKYKKLIPISFFIGLLLTLLLGPVALLRYSLSIITCIELIIYMVIFDNEK